MQRRDFLLQMGVLLGSAALPSLALAAGHSTMRVAGGWRLNERDWQVGARSLGRPGRLLLISAP